MERRVFRSTAGQWFGYGWLLFAAFNLGDLAWRGSDRTALVIAAVLLAVSGLVYITALRPRLVAGAGGLRIVNPLRDTTLSWAAVTSVEATDAVLVRTGEHRRYRCWAVHAPNRHRTRARRARTRAAAAPAGAERRTTSTGPDSGVKADTAGRTRADYVAAQLEEMSRSGRLTAPEDRTETTTWSRSSLVILAAGLALVLASLLIP